MLQVLALYVGVALIVWSAIRIIKHSQLRKFAMKQVLYKMAFSAAQDTDIELLRKYVRVVKEDGVSSVRANSLRISNSYNDQFISFCNFIDSIEEKL